MQIPVQHKSSFTLYTYIKGGIRRVLASVPERHQCTLDPQRELANGLGISRNTVGRTYAQRGREGLVASAAKEGNRECLRK